MAAPSPPINHDRPLHGVDALSQDKLARRGYVESAIGALRHVTGKSGLVLSVDFFITQNEWDVLAQLGAKAWIYREVLDAA